MNKIAIFCTANDAYIRPSIVALESIRQFHPEHCYFIIANKNRISAENTALLKHFNIQLIHYEGDSTFPDAGIWPKEVWWKLKGPEIFYDLGFSFSMSIDGDILCVKPCDLNDLLPKLKGYAGIENFGPRSGNFEDPDFIRTKYLLGEKIMQGHNANTGVIIWNNRRAVESELFYRSRACYQECTAVQPRMFRAVDQSLLALVSVLEPVLPWQILDSGYNYRIHNKHVQEEDIREEDIRNYHFTGAKPWAPPLFLESLKDPRLLSYRDKWHAFVERLQVFNRDLTRRKPHYVLRMGKRSVYWYEDVVTRIILCSPGSRLLLKGIMAFRHPRTVLARLRYRVGKTFSNSAQ